MVRHRGSRRAGADRDRRLVELRPARHRQRHRDHRRRARREASLVPAWRGYAHPSADGAIFQIIQAAVDAGIGREALDETIQFVREKARPWIDSGQERASDDPYTIRTVGDLTSASTPPRRCSTAPASPSTRRWRTPPRRASRRRRSRPPRPRCSPPRWHSPPPRNPVRIVGTPLDAGRAQPRPPLAQRPHPHAARSGALEGGDRRQPRAQRREPALPRLELIDRIIRTAAP